MPYKDPAKAAAQKKRWREANKDKETKRAKERLPNTWHRDNRKKSLMSAAKGRASKRGTQFTLTEEDFEIPSVCPVFGVDLKRGTGRGGVISESPSLDEIVAGEGYVPGNVQVISYKANVMKRDASPEELLQFADWIYKIFGGRNG